MQDDFFELSPGPQYLIHDLFAYNLMNQRYDMKNQRLLRNRPLLEIYLDYQIVPPTDLSTLSNIYGQNVLREDQSSVSDYMNLYSDLYHGSEEKPLSRLCFCWLEQSRTNHLYRLWHKYRSCKSDFLKSVMKQCWNCLN